MTLPKFTVIVDTFNHQNFIQKALDSVFDQDFPRSDYEVIVIDDGSTDNTPAILQGFPEKLRIVNKQNGGQASAFNTAIPLARGEFIAFLDGDDWWARDKLAAVWDAFNTDAHLGVVGHGFYEFDENSQRARAVVPGTARRVSLRGLKDGIEFGNLMCFFGTSRVAIRRRVLALVGTIPKSLVVEADEFMSTMAVAKSEAIILERPLTFYRLHIGNLYHFRDGDSERSRRKMSVLVNLSESLKHGLLDQGLNEPVVQAVITPINLEAKRLKLLLDGGWPWETFQLERVVLQRAYKSMNWKYRLFKICSLALTFILPPKTFYRLRRFYNRRNLKRLRSFTGEPIPTADIHYYEADENGK